jgi:hypothetical protein
MIRKALISILPLAFLSCAQTSAQTVDDLIKKTIEAQGGAEKLKAVRSIKLTGRMVQQSLEKEMDAKNAEFEAIIGKELAGVNSKLAGKKLDAIKVMTKKEYDEKQEK